MDDMKKLMDAFTREEGVEESKQLGSNVFLQLKSYCLELLDLLQNPKKHTSAIPGLLLFLRNSPPTTLQPFFDYTLFPLLLLLDAAVECRSAKKADSEKLPAFDVPRTPFEVSDSVAEGVVNCLQELLRKCPLKSVDQMVLLLKKLTYGALLSPSEASEEFREGIMLCFRELLLSIHSCSNDSCSCKQIIDSPSLWEDIYKDQPVGTSFQYSSDSEVCLLAFIRSQTASAAVGHWLSLLLKAADTEAARGHQGSARLRVEAFKTLRILVAKVGSADALAFFLPGVVSQFAKVLRASKMMISGAAGSVEAIDQAIRGLAEYLMIVLQDDANISVLGIEAASNFNSSECKSTLSLLEELRHLPVKARDQNNPVECTSDEAGRTSPSKTELKDMESSVPVGGIGCLHVNRTKDWIEKTSTHINKLLSATFPHICIHPSQKVRKGLVAAIKGLLSNCQYTLLESRLMLLECLCALVVDDSEDVSATAQEFLGYLFSQIRKPLIERDAAEIFSRHVEKLPKLVLSNEEPLAVLHAQQLLVIIFYSGPSLVVEYLQSPVGAARFLDVFASCLSQNSVFSGSLNKVISTRPASTLGYLPSIAELKSGTDFFNYGFPLINATSSEAPRRSLIKEKHIQEPAEAAQKNHELPRMPPWFGYVGSLKLYQPLAGILRLVGLSLVADCRHEGLLPHVTETLLGYFRKLVSELRMREYKKESWQSWYDRTGSGQLLRQASTAACMLNEMIFGLSDQAINGFARIFHRSHIESEGAQVQSCKHDCALRESVWRIPQNEGVRTRLIDCIGGILHEYLSAEVWNIPIEHRAVDMQPDVEVEDVTLYFFQDKLSKLDWHNTYDDYILLEQVIIDGVGIFSMCLGRDFASSGFIHSSLYLLLEHLSSSNYQVRNAVDSVLHILSATFGYSTVGQLVLENADYVIDSICRQLRHLDLNRHVPNVLASMLSYIGVAHKILPLLEEPMRSVSLELEILGRHEHPDLTIPFLKALAEITKASKHEACSLSPQAESFAIHVRSIISNAEESTDQWEIILFKLNDSRRYRRTVGSIVGSCITVATPLLASFRRETCFTALDVIESGMLALAKVEEAYKHERETKEAMEEALESKSLYQLKDTLDAAEEGTDENRLLPAMNKIWPLLIACIQNKDPVAVRRCTNVVSNVMGICGGDFFSRRFHTDGTHFWKLLTISPFQKKINFKDDKSPLQLPYRTSSMTSEDSVSEISSLKVQTAVLNMIADLSLNKRTAPALDLVLKKVSGLVVGIACSGVVGLLDASLNALHGLASIDPDLIWLLLADVYYGKKIEISPPRSNLPELFEVLPPPSSPKEYLYVQYGGQSYGFDIDFSSVEVVFIKLHSQDFTNQMYI
ncbi:hypothetical protein L6164_036986 [Bauhinia variegata]|uniref:Uncharacterized protein n=1 Tax=Bauhinia variegata TaxID=167791 RepID=A0ACB9KIP4_BAUVA|nr:hypothetical protein L6164_036986 [Bauhinia variegata]